MQRPALDEVTSVHRRLDQAAIIDTALSLAERDPRATISVRSLGQHLGADPTAIYRHFRSKDDLMRSLIDALHARVLDRLTRPARWQDRLVELAELTMSVHLEHPAIAIEAASLTTSGPAESMTIEYVLQSLKDAGLDDDGIVRHYSLLASFQLSCTSGRARALRHRDPENIDASAWFDRPLLTNPKNQPLTTALHADLTALRHDEVYRFGIKSIIEGVERAVPRQREGEL